MLDKDEILVSYDVSSLFTNVPIGEAVTVIREMLRKDEDLISRTKLSPDEVADLLELCLRSTYFSFNGDFYEQTEGAAMGSPVSAVVANLYMEHFETLALSSAPVRPRIWKRYVDDVLSIQKKGDDVDRLCDHLNSVRPSIQFTTELEKDGALPFLDTTLRRKEDGHLDITVYRKPTHTDRYLNFNSHHPTRVKRGLVRCLYDRAREVTQSADNLKKEEDHLMEVLRNNGYPKQFIHRSSFPTQAPNPDAESLTEDTADDRKPLVMLPYVANMSEDIKRVCEKFGLRVVFKSGLTIRSMLTRVKDPIPMDKQSMVVYQIPCSCGQVYIGETKRRLETRLKEHRDACVKQDLQRSAIAEHAWSNDHPIRWEESKVIDKARYDGELRVKEALHIQMMPSEKRFNRDGGLEIPGCWIATVKKIEEGVVP